MGKHKNPAQDDGNNSGKDGKPGPMVDPSKQSGKHGKGDQGDGKK